MVALLTQSSIVKSPVIEREAESAAEAYCEEAAAKAIASVDWTKGKSVVHSVVPLLVRLLAATFVC